MLQVTFPCFCESQALHFKAQAGQNDIKMIQKKMQIMFEILAK